MLNKHENIDSWFGRGFLILILLFVLSFTESNSREQHELPRVSISQIDLDNSALLLEPNCNLDQECPQTVLQHFSSITENHKLHSLHSDLSSARNLKQETENFFKFKPDLLRQKSYATLSSKRGEIPSV